MGTISEKDRKLIERAIENAEKSDMKFHIGSVMTENGKVVGNGYNSKRSQYCFDGKKFNHNSCHSEMAAIIDASRRTQRRRRKRSRPGKSNIYTAKVSKEGMISNSFPCFRCVQWMKEVGIRHIFYIDNNREIQIINIRDIDNFQSFKCYSDRICYWDRV